ncbi:MAG: hypothetical protein IKC82_07725 [Lentisphaeria bacterium]|nr:hypothetical protein [Lentisphaeria bacterium]
MKATTVGFSRFAIGVNYWASNAGMRMWRYFDAAEVEADFAVLHENGINTVRVFPLWPDFQPVTWARGSAGEPKELVFPDGLPLPEKGLRSYGLDPVMMERFRIVADLALKYDLQMIVGLLTGWMSGCLFAPPALAERHMGTDFFALRLQKMFLEGFVKEMKDHPAIIAWEPGNECNCMSHFEHDCAWNWLNLITSTIRLADPTRPVYAGMHGGTNYNNRGFTLMDQGELCDALTTHPYPTFTPHCGKSALNNTPAVYHATAQTLFYRGISKKPAFIEEIGSFGPGYLSEERTEKYLYTVLYSALVHGMDSVIWWCGFSMDRCNEEFPYRWIPMEWDLGALTYDRKPIGAAKATKRFAEELKQLPFDELPPRKVDAVVIITDLKDSWKTAFGTFILSKEAGFEVEYCNIDTVDEVPESDFYIMPSISRYDTISLIKYRKLLAKLEQGATLVVTADDGILVPFAEYFGCRLDYSAELPENLGFTVDGQHYEFNAAFTRRMLNIDGEVVATLDDGSPFIVRHKYGKGQAIFVNAALENEAFAKGNEYHKIYRKLARLAGVEIEDKSPAIGVTKHIMPDGKLLKFYINYADTTVDGMPANSVKYEIQ